MRWADPLDRDPATRAPDARRYLAVMTTENEKPAAPYSCSKAPSRPRALGSAGLLHDVIWRLRKSRISGTISSPLSSSAKWPVSIR